MQPRGLPFWVVAPEFLAVSDWERHAVVADLRGSFTGYGGSLPATIDGAANPAPTDIDRPDFTGHVDGRLDVSRDLRLTAQARLHVATDNPGSPNIQAGLARYPLATTFGGTVGFDQTFNRLQVSAGATDRSHHLSAEQAHRRHLCDQRRPRLQPVWRGRAHLLRGDAGRQAVRRGRGRHARARSAVRPQRRSSAIPPAATPRPAPRSSSRGS